MRKNVDKYMQKAVEKYVRNYVDQLQQKYDFLQIIKDIKFYKGHLFFIIKQSRVSKGHFQVLTHMDKYFRKVILC